jgi:rubrerythrin
VSRRGGGAGSESRPISTIDDFLTHAYVIELEATERYDNLAYQMDMHNNDEAAGLFRKLAAAEAKHLAAIKARLEGREVMLRAPWDYQWHGEESPEAADIQDVHYLMTAYHALQIALKGEERALAFFDTLAKQSSDKEIRKIAAEFADEERDHVRLVKDALAATPQTPPDWDHDPDPTTAGD